MSVVKMSNEAYTEFKSFLQENGVEKFDIRINLAGVGWGGPVFNIVLDEQSDNDEVDKIEDITFFVDKELVKDFEGFTLLSSDENGGRGLSLKPVKESEGGCSSCSSCH